MRVKLFFKSARKVFEGIKEAYLKTVMADGGTGYGLIYFGTTATTTYWLAWGNKWWGNGKMSGILILCGLGISSFCLLLGWLSCKGKKAQGK